MPEPNFHHPPSSQSQSPLRRLPPELRQQIWTYLVPPLSPALLLPLHPSLLQTAQFFYADLLPHLYTRPFTAHPTLLTALPYHKSRSRPVPAHLAARYSRRWVLQVRLDTDARWTRAQVKDAFDGAAELRVEVGQAQYRGAGGENLVPLAGVRGVKLARVVGWGEDGGEGRALEALMMMPEDGGHLMGEEDKGRGWEEGFGEGYRRGWEEGRAEVRVGA